MTKDINRSNYLIFMITDREDVDQRQQTLPTWLLADDVGITNRSAIVDNHRWGCLFMRHHLA